MSHHHTHAPVDHNMAFVVGVALNTAFVVVEAGAGYWASSLALMADAGHNLSDVLGLLLAWGASALGRRSPTPRLTYGLGRTTILAALANAALLLVAIGGIAWEAVRRFGVETDVAPMVVVAVAAIGVAINTLTALLFLSGQKEDLNIRGAFLHMVADAGISAGVVAGGLVIRATGWNWVDPAISLFIVAVIGISTWGLLRESLDMALDAVPAGIDLKEVEVYLASLPGVSAVHHVHVWGMSTTKTAMTAHLIKPDGRLDDALLAEASHELHHRFGIDHATLQLEHGGLRVYKLGQASDHN